ncbi:unnamed protein product [Lymnaea stagnalis]|uniref:RING-type E3 ubiquitin transferase n=1 Tax=Lymnaea stagnalis TaxID=6523 RepID=A0AAV2IB37_LYMST
MFRNSIKRLTFGKKKAKSDVEADVNLGFGLGYRVVRGPDWKWCDQDMHEGYVGTVVEIGGQGLSKTHRNYVRVRWDGGSRHWYRAGHGGKYDLLVFDNAQDGTQHPKVMCDECKTEGIRGVRWKCGSCYNYDLCSACYGGDKHDLSHPFLRIDNPWSKLHHKVPCRMESQKVQAMGIFTGSAVRRGADWRWGEQDGGDGEEGRVHAILSSGTDSGRDTAHVVWPNGEAHEYRVGTEGRVDLKCVRSTSGGGYYRCHMPVFGKIEEPAKRKNCNFKIGEFVKIDVDINTLKILQHGHGGCDSDTYTRKVGRVCAIDKDGDIIVQYADGVQKTYNPQGLGQVWLNAQHVIPTVPNTPTEVKGLSEDVDTSTGSNGGLVNGTLQCKVCLSREACVTFVPCGHLVCCPECSAEVDHCPVCRTNIEHWIRTFIS